MRRVVFGLLVVLSLGGCSVKEPPLPSPVAQAPKAARGGTALPLDSLKLPPGFSIEVYAEVPGARSLTLGPDGTVYVGNRRPRGSVYAVPDKDRDYRADGVVTLATDLNLPNGVALRDGDLYVAEVSRILRFDEVAAHLNSPPAPVVVYDQLPKETHHGWKFIAFGPDGRLYVPVGAPCNVCESEDERFATIMRMQPDGTEVEVFARGIRNTVGFDWNPATDVLWFTDNGRDWLGDDLPPEELNRAPEAGLHFGFPYVYGNNRPDPDFGSRKGGRTFVPPAMEFVAHAAALGMRFYQGEMFPQGYRNQIIVAQHGSWNRTTPVGYRVMLVQVEGDRAVGKEVFVEGWLGDDGKSWGRPVDVQALDDGSLLVSDDQAGVLYRITYRDPATK